MGHRRVPALAGLLLLAVPGPAGLDAALHAHGDRRGNALGGRPAPHRPARRPAGASEPDGDGPARPRTGGGRRGPGGHRRPRRPRCGARRARPARAAGGDLAAPGRPAGDLTGAAALDDGRDRPAVGGRPRDRDGGAVRGRPRAVLPPRRGPGGRARRGQDRPAGARLGRRRDGPGGGPAPHDDGPRRQRAGPPGRRRSRLHRRDRAAVGLAAGVGLNLDGAGGPRRGARATGPARRARRA